MGVFNLFVWLFCVVVIIKVQSKSILADNLTSTAHPQVSMVKRCGTPNTYFTSHSNQSRVRRDACYNSSWRNTRIVTYRVVNEPTYPHGHNLVSPGLLNKKRVEMLIKKAFKEWAPHCGLRFERLLSGCADIVFSFRSGNQAHWKPFDGPFGELARAIPLSDNGAWVDFDNEENWVDDHPRNQRYNLINFYLTALHEIGHVLGLPHSDNKHSIMYEFINNSVKTLHWEDKLKMQALYNV